MKLKSRLMLGVSGTLIILLIFAGSGIDEIRKLNTVIEDIVQNRYQKVELAASIRFEVGNIARHLGELMLTNEADEMGAIIDNITQSDSKALTALAGLEKITGLEEQNETIAQLKETLNSYLQYEQQVIGLVKENREDRAKIILVNDSKRVLNQLTQLIDTINSFEEDKMSESLILSQAVLNQGITVFIFLLLIGLVLGIAISAWLIRSISGLTRLTSALQSVTVDGDMTSLPRLTVRSRDEIGMISQTFNEMAEALEEHVQSEQESNNALQAQNWLKSTVAETTSLVQGVQELTSFAGLLINQICTIIQSGYGVFYVSQGKKNQQEIISIASYAGLNVETDPIKFRPGEGLVGQCFSENKSVCLTKIPDHYLQIKSGLGKTPPAYLYILPVEFEGTVIAVLELGCLQDLSSLEKEYLELTRYNIGIALNRIFNHMKVQRLLMESQALTEELQTQAEELQVQQEELKTFNEKLEEQYKNSEEKTLEITRAKAILEQQTKELASSSKYKSEFLSNMSHELRTPLNSLLILAKMLADNKENNLTQKQVQYAEIILSSGYDLLNLINDILDLSKIEAGKLEIKAEEISLQGLKETMETQFFQIALQKNLDFRIHIDNKLPANILTDGHYLKQIMRNLLSNALKFTEQGYVHLAIKESNDQIAFAITDTGIGIPQGKQDIIFEAFRQADGTTSRKYGGTGLGLSICKELAGLLGGHITLESYEGQGSTFTLFLPRQLKNPETETRMETASGSNQVSHDWDDRDQLLKGRKVLVVDDDMRNIYAITAALEELKIEVRFAEHGREALDILKQNVGIDLILMDIMMPQMDGYEAMQEIRKLPQYADVPIIALTAKAMKGDREKCLQAGASDYISKPLDIEKLVSLLRVWLYR